MNIQTLTAQLTQAQAGASIQDSTSIVSPGVQELRDTAPVITQEEIDQNPMLSVASVILWVDGPLPEGVTLPDDADTKRILIDRQKHPIGFPGEAAALSYLDSDDGYKLIQTVFSQGATDIGIRALNGGGVPLWDMLVFSLNADGTVNAFLDTPETSEDSGASIE